MVQASTFSLITSQDDYTRGSKRKDQLHATLLYPPTNLHLIQWQCPGPAGFSLFQDKGCLVTSLEKGSQDQEATGH